MSDGEFGRWISLWQAARSKIFYGNQYIICFARLTKCSPEASLSVIEMYTTAYYHHTDPNNFAWGWYLAVYAEIWIANPWLGFGIGSVELFGYLKSTIKDPSYNAYSLGDNRPLPHDKASKVQGKR